MAARIEPAMTSGGLLKLYQAMWAPYYDAVLRTLGANGVIFPFGDPHHGQPNATSFTSKGAQQVVCTWSEAPASFNTPLDLTDAESFLGIMPKITFDGVDEEADSPDIDFFSPGDSSNDSAFSVGAWVNLPDSSVVRSILAKRSNTAGSREWSFQVNADDTFRLQVFDDSVANANRVSDAAIPLARWAFLAMTYDGSGGATSMDGVTLYVDGIAVAATSNNSGVYVAMENGTQPLSIAHDNSGTSDAATNFVDGEMLGGPIGPFYAQKELSATEVKALYDLGRAAAGL